ncbi:MAG: hypothetical protein KDJ42_00045, partial [Alphaproteobacteria bacterium]|nr:hypothetical protein [Alphaproteobacteria bacterium]
MTDILNEIERINQELLPKFEQVCRDAMEGTEFEYLVCNISYVPEETYYAFVCVFDAPFFKLGNGEMFRIPPAPPGKEWLKFRFDIPSTLYLNSETVAEYEVIAT